MVNNQTKPVYKDGHSSYLRAFSFNPLSFLNPIKLVLSLVSALQLLPAALLDKAFSGSLRANAPVFNQIIKGIIGGIWLLPRLILNPFAYPSEIPIWGAILDFLKKPFVMLTAKRSAPNAAAISEAPIKLSCSNSNEAINKLLIKNQQRSNNVNVERKKSGNDLVFVPTKRRRPFFFSSNRKDESNLRQPEKLFYKEIKRKKPNSVRNKRKVKSL